MKWVESLWSLWDRTVGRVSVIIGGLGLIAGAIILVLNLVAPQGPDCFSNGLSMSEFESCVFDERDIYKRESFRKGWIGKQVTGVSSMGTILPHDESRSAAESNNEVIVLLSSWGPWESNARSLIECRKDFESSVEARKYWQKLQGYTEDSDVRWTGKIAEVTRDALPVEDCLVIEEVRN